MSRLAFPARSARPFARAALAGAVGCAVAALLVLAPTPALAADPLGGPVGGPLLASAGVVATPGATPLPAHLAASWVVADATTGTVLAAQDAHGRFRPASTLKTLTALVTLPLLDKSSVYVGRDSDTRAEGSKVGIIMGAPYTVDQLFYGLFLASGNDAASALANDAGGTAVTVQRMNDTARQLQADDTHVVNPSGLDADGQVTSAYDLALFAKAGLQRADFRAYTLTKRYAFPGRPPKNPLAPRPTFQIQNQNRLLMHGYPGIVGVKTGYTSLAGRTYVAAAQRSGHLIVVALMRITGPSENAGRALLDWGFRNVGKPGVGTLVDPVVEASASPSAEGPKASPVAAAVGGASGSGLATQAWIGLGLGAVVLVGSGALGLGRRRRRDRRTAGRLASDARRGARS
ncbi:MAG: D-alanyl-D-alanine carboxypeptidase family protein [Actinomycetes bacterium]